MIIYLEDKNAASLARILMDLKANFIKKYARISTKDFPYPDKVDEERYQTVNDILSQMRMTNRTTNI